MKETKAFDLSSLIDYFLTTFFIFGAHRNRAGLPT